MAHFFWGLRPDQVCQQRRREVPKNLDKSIHENATGPKRAKGDSGEVEQHSLKDQIEADRYLNSKKAARKKLKGLGLTKLVPPGTC
jgi:hypothetical protein